MIMVSVALVKHIYVIVPILLINYHADHNECITNTHTCDQVCHNSHGSYYCTCNSGYRLNADQRTCDGNLY